MRTRALLPLASLSLFLSVVPVSALASPTAGPTAEPNPTLVEASAASAPEPDLAARLDQLRSAITEIEHQRAVVQALRARETKRMWPGELPSDGRYPGSVVCRDGSVVYPRSPSETALAFCAGSRANP